MPDPRNIQKPIGIPKEGERILPWAQRSTSRINDLGTTLGRTSYDYPISFLWSVVIDSTTQKGRVGAGVWVDDVAYPVSAATNIVLSSGYNVIYLNYTIGTSAAISTTVSTDTTEADALDGVPADTASNLYVPLHCVRDYTDDIPSHSGARLLVHIRDYTTLAITKIAYGVAGDILYHNGTRWTRLAKPTGFAYDPVLRHDGTDPYWHEPSTNCS